ncbi:putative glucan endo-1,3-beta-D-glucosidase [Helianthus annuus]|uniref:Glucan endo-1,3-beta-D-glucosidase n=2 Tax=Helianthus annuus TaxID=4232 RepID=A0A9K3NIG6_HELAN|nr:putative glucan endo-1,3-beta-D-glucosidase [Helianthus annuus]KAJ0910172.1 putative glucan endo-1,3-beta-D-glucosidase [Helianthus annuus]KAJ0913838.1 putative glucan endo-1,3-beta-D-glucosidase [Helianthus annuus]
MSSMATLLIILGLLASFLDTTESQIGVSYGMFGNNLPSETDAISLYNSNDIRMMRLYFPNQAALQALRGSNIEVMVGVQNSELSYVAASRNNSFDWVWRNIVTYSDVKFRYISVGNEVNPSDGTLAPLVYIALTNIHEAVVFYGLRNQIKVSTAIDTTLIGANYPPSQGAFKAQVRAYIDPIIAFLVANNAPLLVNVFPYFSYVDNPVDISLAYATFTSPGIVVQDGALGYQNLFDAIVDVVYSALEKAGGPWVEIVVSETGWPSAGASAATFNNARTYLRNMVAHARWGTPKRPGRAIQTYLFSMFDENNKEPQIEKNFGLFYPNQTTKYNLYFN